MRAIRVTELGGPEVLRYVAKPDPIAGRNQLLVRTQAIGVNFIDIYFRTGLYKGALPYVPGSEGTGVVVGVGEGPDTKGFAVGDRVAWAAAPGSYAELVTVPGLVAVKVPEGLSPEVAASTLLQGLTAHYLITSVYEAKEGDDILVHAGAGGVGLLLTQLAAARGVRVFTTVSSDEKERVSRAAGASEVLRYSDDLPVAVRKLTKGQGVAAVYDGVGAATFESSLRSVRVRGVLALFGAASGPVPPFDPQRLSAAGSISLTRPTLGHFTRNREELQWRADELFGAIAAGALTVTVGATYPLADAAQAHSDLAARKTTGSIVLVP